MLRERALGVAQTDERSSAFEALARQHLDSSYRLAALILRDHVEAQDATHDAFVMAWQRWSSLRDVSKFDAWFGRILVNVCRDRLRRTKRRPVVDISAALEVSGGSDTASKVDDRDAMERAFRQLSPDHRIVVAMRFYLDLSVDQIAERVGAPTGTVKSRLHNALKQIGTELSLPFDGEELES